MTDIKLNIWFFEYLDLIFYPNCFTLPNKTKTKTKNKAKATMLYQCTNIPYCLTTVALMVIKRVGRGFSYDVTDIFDITTIEKFAAVDKKGYIIYNDLRLEATFLDERPCHVVLTNVGRRLKKISA